MVVETEAVSEVRRMAQLDKYPTFEPDAFLELVDVAKGANDPAQLHRVISDVMRSGTICPRPSELLAALRGPLQFEPMVSPQRQWRCSRCDNSGWIINHALWTCERKGGAVFTRKERITEAQANELWPKIDTQVQMIYSGARKCNCLLESVRPSS